MIPGAVDETAARTPSSPGTTGRACPAPGAPEGEGPPSLRLGVERGTAATLAVAALLLALLALPGFVADHRQASVPLLVASLVLLGLMVVSLPAALLLRPGPVRAGAWVPVAAFVGLLVLRGLELHEPTADGSVPWLVGLSLVACSCAALAEVRPVRAGAICVGTVAALVAVHAGGSPVTHVLVEFLGLALLAGALIVGVRILRVRADRADRAERDARRSFEEHRRRAAVEAERVHTDALLHDTVLATFLAAAGGHAPARTTEMARTALQIVSETGEHLDGAPAVPTTLGEALAAAARELAPFRTLAQVDLAAAHDVVLPSDVADAVVSALLQALTNSVRHAGPEARTTAVAARLDDGGVRVTVADDGVGFDPAEAAPGRLGVRVSIVERMHLVGATATVGSSPGRGTTVTLEWRPPRDAATTVERRPGEALLTLVPRRRLYRLLGVLIVVAVLVAVADAVVVTHAYGSVAASVLGLALLPALVRGARRGSTSDGVAWGTTAVGCLLCGVATIGLDAAAFDYVSVSRYTCGVLAGAVLGWMAGRRLPPVVAVAVLVAQVAIWAGPSGVLRLGLAAEIVVVVIALLLHRAVLEVTAAARVAAERHHDLTIRQAELDAYHLERGRRLRHARRAAEPLLRHVVEVGGELDERASAECRVLEQALRDEIRGRRLLNDAVRRVVATHRHRGALVQVLDDGGLEGLDPEALDALLDDLADRLAPVRSSRIVVRTGQPDSDTAVTVVASTPDETAAALGLDADDDVDLWFTLPRPGPTAAPVGRAPEPALARSGR